MGARLVQGFITHQKPTASESNFFGRFAMQFGAMRVQYRCNVGAIFSRFGAIRVQYGCKAVLGAYFDFELE